MLVAALGLGTTSGCYVQHPDFVEPENDADVTGGDGFGDSSSGDDPGTTESTGTESTGTESTGTETTGTDTAGSGTADLDAGDDGAFLPDLADMEDEVHRAFVTAAVYSGDLTEIVGADGACQAAATDADLHGVWRAIISAPGIDVRDRIVIVGPVENMNGQRVADDAEDLFDGTLQAAIEYDEYGVQQFGRAWTGSLSNGQESSDTCAAWTTSTDGAGQAGNIASVFGTWLEGSSQPCHKNERLYCVSQ